MILFSNVLITDRRASASGLNRVDRLDLFKYCLASYGCIDSITEVIIYCQLEGGYADRADELHTFIHETFGGRRITIHPHSPSNQAEWKAALLQTPLLETTEPILYLGSPACAFAPRR